MRITYAIENTIGCIKVFLSDAADETAFQEAMTDRLVTFLASSDLKAAIITILEEEGGDKEMSHDSAVPAHLLPIHRALESATLPMAAVLHATPSRAASFIAAACPFGFTSCEDSVDTVEQEAKAHLRAFTERRPPHVIRAVMQSMRNGETLSAEEALIKETMLFCALCTRSSEGTAL